MGEGEYNVISLTYIPLPLIPSRQGRGKLTFYECIKFAFTKGENRFNFSFQRVNLCYLPLKGTGATPPFF